MFPLIPVIYICSELTRIVWAGERSEALPTLTEVAVVEETASTVVTLSVLLEYPQVPRMDRRDLRHSRH